MIACLDIFLLNNMFRIIREFINNVKRRVDEGQVTVKEVKACLTIMIPKLKLVKEITALLSPRFRASLETRRGENGAIYKE